MPVRFEGLGTEPIASVLNAAGEQVPCVVSPQESDGENFASLTNTSSDTRSVNTTLNSFVVTSAGLFTEADVGKVISGTGIPANAMIVSFNSASSVTFKTPPTGGFPHGRAATATAAITATFREGFAGTYATSRIRGVVRQNAVVALDLADGTAFPTDLGGTFAFQYTEDGTNATITEVRKITTFSAVRNFGLQNAGASFRLMFAPSRNLTANETITITLTNSFQYDGEFVHLADQHLERANTAAGTVFTFAKGWNKAGVSTDVFTDNDVAVLGRTAITTTAYEILVDLSDTTNFPHMNTGRIDIEYLKIAIDPANNSVGTVRIGVITRIDATNADISYVFNVPFGKSPARILSINRFSPNQMKMGVSGGVWLYGITNRKDVNNAAVNTGVTLNSPRGVTTVTPAVGDVLVKYLHTGGSGWDSLVESFYHSHPNVDD